MAALVETDDTVLAEVDAVGITAVVESDGEPQRSVVEDGASGVAVGYDESSRRDYRRCAAAEGRSHAIAVEAVAVVEVE